MPSPQGKLLRRRRTRSDYAANGRAPAGCTSRPKHVHQHAVWAIRGLRSFQPATVARGIRLLGTAILGAQSLTEEFLPADRSERLWRAGTRRSPIIVTGGALICLANALFLGPADAPHPGPWPTTHGSGTNRAVTRPHVVTTPQAGTAVPSVPNPEETVAEPLSMNAPPAGDAHRGLPDTADLDLFGLVEGLPPAPDNPELESALSLLDRMAQRDQSIPQPQQPAGPLPGPPPADSPAAAPSPAIGAPDPLPGPDAKQTGAPSP